MSCAAGGAAASVGARAAAPRCRHRSPAQSTWAIRLGPQEQQAGDKGSNAAGLQLAAHASTWSSKEIKAQFVLAIYFPIT